jgi:predicted nucleic acid-binding protein
MSDFRQTAADRFERAADRMSNAGFLDEERGFRDAAAQIRAGLSLEEIQALEQRMLTGQKPRLVNRLTALAAMGEYDSGGGGDSQGSAASSTADAVDDETVITDLESGASQLLSTAASTGLSDPFSSAQGGWISSSQNINPYTTLDGASDVNNPNFYTGGQNINPFTGESTDSFSGSVTTPQLPQPTDPAWAAFGYSGPPPSILSSPDLLAQLDAPANSNIASDAPATTPVGSVAGGPTAGVPAFDTDYAGNNYLVYTKSDGSVIWVDPDTGAVSQPQLNIPVTPGAAPQYPPDFVFDDGTETPAAQTTTNTQSVVPVAAAVDPQLTPAQEAQLNAAIQQAVGPPDPNPVNAGPPGSINDVLAGTDWAPPAPTQNQPSDQPGSQPGQTMEQQDQENWEAAKSGMWDAAVDMAQGLLKASLFPALGPLALIGPLQPSLAWAKSGAPAPTGDPVRDARLQDNYQSGAWVTRVVAMAAPIGGEGLLDSAMVSLESELPSIAASLPGTLGPEVENSLQLIADAAPAQEKVFLDTTIIDAIRRGNTAIENQVLAARASGIDLAIPRPVYTEALTGKWGADAANIIERLGLPIDEGAGLGSRIASYDEYVDQSIRFEGFEGNPKLQGDLVIGASAIARDAALWTLDQRSLMALGQLGVRIWVPPVP